MAILASLRAATELDRQTPTMVDLAFAVRGERLPRDYASPLAAALLEVLPWLAESEANGVHPVRAPLTDYGLVLSRRARLVLRIPAERAAAALCLSGMRLRVGDAELLVGEAMLRPIEAFATVRSRLVATDASDEAGFLEDVARQLAAMDVVASPICGRPESVGDGARRIRGYGLALHEVSPAQSLRLQARGLGPGRRLGCGVFVHHKIIEGLGPLPE